MKKAILAFISAVIYCAHVAAGGCHSDCNLDCFDFDSVFSFDLGGGFRKDKIQWSSFEPGLEIREKWSDIKLGVIDGSAQMIAMEQYLLRFDFDYGWVCHKGHQRVTTYNISTPSRTLISDLSSRTKGNVYDLSGAIGYQLNWNCYQYALTPMVGYSYHLQKFSNHGYSDEIDPTNALFADINNSYKYRWMGPWVGFAAILQPTCEWQVYLDYAYHWARVQAEVDENFLIGEETRHLKSNRGHGNEVTVGTNYTFCGGWFAGLKFNYKEFCSKKGRLSNDFTCSNVGSLKWTSYTGTLDIGYVF